MIRRALQAAALIALIVCLALAFRLDGPPLNSLDHDPIAAARQAGGR